MASWECEKCGGYCYVHDNPNYSGMPTACVFVLPTADFKKVLPENELIAEIEDDTGDAIAATVRNKRKI
jgi:hypothetical protein